MNIDFPPPSNGTYNNAGSCRRLASYLEHEDLERIEKGIYTEGFFNLEEDNLYKSQVIKDIDNNIGQLLKTDAKFYAIHVSPSQKELQVMGTTEAEQAEFTTCLYDKNRERIIPVAVYTPLKQTNKTKVVIFNHGYDQNKNIHSNQTYAYLTRFLSRKGYYIISIQHELPHDPLLAMHEPFMETRMPNWDRGKNNILFTIHEFKKLKPNLKWDELIMIGHSNGGDMAMLFATEYPDMVSKVISLDHRRMIIPRTNKFRTLTLRGCDYDADKDVLPTEKEQLEYSIKVIKLEGITHSNMSENGATDQHDLINKYIYEFIK